MSLNLYNTFTNKKEKFVSLEKGRVKMYSCGPTVYNYASIGNMWYYLTADILRRYLEYSGYEVRHIKNITDVGHFTNDENLGVTGEDKLDKTARQEKKDPLEIAKYYTKFFLEDEKKLNIKNPHFRPKPTQEIEAMLQIIERLVKEKYAYETDDGVYFSVAKFPNYGKLSNNTVEQIKAGARVCVNENKKDPADFALWIKCVGKNKHHILRWESPWGVGFPGWHIECSAMAIKYLGDTIDIHTGGEDNIFPHHECEIAQSEAFTQKPFARYWIHVRHFLVDGKKMSKSLGNIFVVSTVPDKRFPSLEEKGYHPLVFRTLKLSSHYRSKANFTFTAMDQAKKTWEKINKFQLELTNYSEKISSETETQENKIPITTENEALSLDINSYRSRFEKAMDDDLNTPQALTVILDLIKEGNKLLAKNLLQNPQEVIALMKNFDKVFAILNQASFKKTIPAEIKKLGEKRAIARKAGDFQKADRLREEIQAKGYEILDQDEKYQLKSL
ncbi:MAG: cysteine--tRNA ligase [Patescibacteria group bacterium]|nr:cysteine--tRNA ligase [Patescibacteria group bacterium]